MRVLDTPYMETLERRSLLAASLSAGGTLAIAGRHRDDDVEIFLNAVLPKHLLVTFNGVETVFEAARVKRIYVNCGEGNDSVQMRDASDYVTIHGGPVIPVERPTTLLGGLGVDDLEGSDAANFIDGQDGDDLVYGGQADDTLLGGDGDDQIDAGNIGTTSRGGSIMRGGNGNDFLYGGNGNDSISGGPGNDVINGRAGRDTLQGDSGHDVIIATGRGTKGGIVKGGPGDDALSGRAGVPLFGGPGSDEFETPAFIWVQDAEIGETVHLDHLVR
ncbi:MAG: calcium binding hemolysin protein [Phycisphaerales bacterium]|nr:calcium binding hemolysin protein [Phycisphaerales bacterium]